MEPSVPDYSLGVHVEVNRNFDTVIPHRGYVMKVTYMILLVVACAIGVVAYWFYSSWGLNGPLLKGVTPPLRVINVLSKDLYHDAHIAGSEHVDYGDLIHVAQKWNRDTPLVIYCSNYQCTASGQGAKELKKLGFTNVRAYEGGTAEWYQLGQSDPAYVVTGPAQQSYLTMVVRDPGIFSDVEKITAQELLLLMKQAGLTK